MPIFLRQYRRKRIPFLVRPLPPVLYIYSQQAAALAVSRGKVRSMHPPLELQPESRVVSTQ